MISIPPVTWPFLVVAVLSLLSGCGPKDDPYVTPTPRPPLLLSELASDGWKAHCPERAGTLEERGGISYQERCYIVQVSRLLMYGPTLTPTDAPALAVLARGVLRSENANLDGGDHVFDDAVLELIRLDTEAALRLLRAEVVAEEDRRELLRRISVSIDEVPAVGEVMLELGHLDGWPEGKPPSKLYGLKSSLSIRWDYLWALPRYRALRPLIFRRAVETKPFPAIARQALNFANDPKLDERARANLYVIAMLADPVPQVPHMLDVLLDHIDPPPKVHLGTIGSKLSNKLGASRDLPPDILETASQLCVPRPGRYDWRDREICFDPPPARPSAMPAPAAAE